MGLLMGLLIAALVSMSHCWGQASPDPGEPKSGANTARLLSADRDWDPITGMARMTAVPVSVRPIDA